MAASPTSPRRAALLGMILKLRSVPCWLVFGLLFPTLVLWGGSTNLINWGPGLLLAGAACLLLLDKDRHGLRGGVWYTIGLLLLLGLMFLRARFSPGASGSENNCALLGFAAAGFLIGRLANGAKSRALFIGLALASILNFVCSVIQTEHPDWNLVYPWRSGGFPSGLFAHYSYSAAFCLGAAGLLVSHCLKEGIWLRSLAIIGAMCALVAIPISLSRGGTLALAFMVAVAVALLLARAFSKSKSVMSTWLPGIALLALILVLGVAVVPLIGRNAGANGFYGDGVRIEFWNAAMQIAADHPWLGGGAGSFAWDVFHVLDDLTVEPGMTHNEALQLAVDYGFPALIGTAILIAVPLILCFWRFVSRTGSGGTAWAAAGLLAMLFQSNFESIFHAAPCAFIAALILGRISRSLWGIDHAAAVNTLRGVNGGERPDIRFLSAVRTHVNDYSAGKTEAVSGLVGLLSQSKDERWRRGSYRLLYWMKIHNEEALRQAIENLGAMATEELGNLSSTPYLDEGKRVSTGSSRAWRMLGSLAFAACALVVTLRGAKLSLALGVAWDPLYHPERMTASQGFEKLLAVAERNHGLGIGRKVLSAALDCIDQFENQEDRENWATAHYPRILQAVPRWRTDPGAALQIAEIVGWTGDVEAALGFYNHAIKFQGRNESLFMAHSFKGQYYYELAISAGAAGQSSKQELYSRRAVECFRNATAASGNANGRLSPYFGWLLKECESLEKKNM